EVARAPVVGLPVAVVVQPVAAHLLLALRLSASDGERRASAAASSARAQTTGGTWRIRLRRTGSEDRHEHQERAGFGTAPPPGVEHHEGCSSKEETIDGLARSKAGVGRVFKHARGRGAAGVRGEAPSDQNRPALRSGARREAAPQSKIAAS